MSKRPIKKTPAPGFMDYNTAMALARHKGKYVRCDEYMQAGWKIGRVRVGPKFAPGLYNINPHTGSEYQFTPQPIDINSVKWRIA